MKTSRDAVRARELEREAEATNDPATWAVASDAWEEAGEPQRAWYAFLRSRGHGDPAVTYARAAEWAAQLQRHEEWVAARYTTNPISLGNRLESTHESLLRGRLVLFRFLSEQPHELFAYEEMPNVITTFHSIVLGRIVHREKARGPVERVRVAGVNGYTYSGTCPIENDTFCNLRRGKPWLR